MSRKQFRRPLRHRQYTDRKWRRDLGHPGVAAAAEDVGDRVRDQDEPRLRLRCRESLRRAGLPPRNRSSLGNLPLKGQQPKSHLPKWQPCRRRLAPVAVKER
jgi:hypothetical protein